MNKAHQYELIVIAYTGKEQESVKDVEEVVKHLGGKVTEYSDDGVKRLAYAIDGEEEGHYLNFILDGIDSDKVNEIYQALNTKASILRYLLVTAADEKYSGGYWDKAADVVALVESVLGITLDDAKFEELQEAIYNDIKE